MNYNNNDIVTRGTRTLYYYNGNFDEHHARVGDSKTAEAAIYGQGGIWAHRRRPARNRNSTSSI